MRFTKMQGAGNDYIYFNVIEQRILSPLDKLAIKLSDRHFGIGGDGIVLIDKAADADFSMRIFNADGSEAEMCGNAIRCVAKYVYDNKLTDKKEISIATLSGVKVIKLLFDENGAVTGAAVNMGKARFDTKDIPSNLPTEQTINYPFTVDGKEYRVTLVNMGNPHCVVVMDDIQSLDLEKLGPVFENHAAFPARINTEFIKINSRDNIDMRVWERGSGETLACGTGACAAVAACVKNNLTDNRVTVNLKGGKLVITYSDDYVIMEGGAVTVFEGEINV